MINLTAFVLFCCVVQAALLFSVIRSAQAWVRKMEAPVDLQPFKTNFVIEAALSLDL